MSSVELTLSINFRALLFLNIALQMSAKLSVAVIADYFCSKNFVLIVNTYFEIDLLIVVRVGA